MARYIIRRLLILPAILFVVSLALFAILLWVPAEQRVQIYLPSTSASITEEEMERLVQTTIERYGLDQPVHVQYVTWLRNLLQGDWGYSPTWKQPVLEGLLQRAPASLELSLFTLIPTVLLAVYLGGAAAQRQNRLADHLIRGASFLGWAFPSFILGLFLMNVLYARLHWFPPGRLSLWASDLVSSPGYHAFTGMLLIDSLLNRNPAVFLDALRHLALPAVTLGTLQWSLLARLMRSSMLEALNQEYITTARAKGVPEERVVARHATPNAVLPVISIAGVSTSLFLTNLMIIEVLFDFNGVGRYAVKAAISFDAPVAMGFVLVMCLTVIFSSLLADIAYSAIDPRVRLD
ncbi:MAG: ABC transporter permease [Anaerolineales bacterium]|nr:ABC transporter permease [Anaerolineales bacterium]